MEKFVLKKSLRSLFSLGLVLSLISLGACQKAQEEEDEGLAPFTQVSGNFTQKDAKGLEGSGTIRMNSNLPGIVSSSSLELKGRLKTAGSSLAVVLYSDSMSVDPSKGIVVKITRSSALTDEVTVDIIVQNIPVGVQPSRVAYLRGSDLNLIVEVHNTLTSARVMLWRKESVTYNLSTVEFDSATASHLKATFPGGGGQGIFAGLILTDARVNSFALGEAKVSTLP